MNQFLERSKQGGAARASSLKRQALSGWGISRAKARFGARDVFPFTLEWIKEGKMGSRPFALNE